MRRVLLMFFSILWILNINAMRQDANNEIEFLKVNKCTEVDLLGEKTNFKTVDGEIVNLQYVIAADPGYDQIFKKIFSTGNNVGGFSGEERLMSLLNSVLFPEAKENDFMIRDIEYLPNESTVFEKKPNLGMLKFDLSCKCICYKEGEKPKKVVAFVVEMQTGYDSLFDNRLCNYGGALKGANPDMPSVVLAFLNNKRYKLRDSTEWIALCKLDSKTGRFIGRIGDVLDIYIINLPKQIEAIDEFKPIYVRDGKDVNQLGREWLKLLSMKHWATQSSSGLGRCIIPKGRMHKEVESALTILSRLNDRELINYIDNENYAMSLLETSAEEGRKKGIEEGRKEGIEEGRKRGIEEGKSQFRLQVARNLLNAKLLNIDAIIKAAELTREEAESFRKEVSEKEE